MSSQLLTHTVVSVISGFLFSQTFTGTLDTMPTMTRLTGAIFIVAFTAIGLFAKKIEALEARTQLSSSTVKKVVIADASLVFIALCSRIASILNNCVEHPSTNWCEGQASIKVFSQGTLGLTLYFGVFFFYFQTARMHRRT